MSNLNDQIKLICPVCHQAAFEKGRSLVCVKNHNFDFARQGYINLLPVQNKHSLHPGDAPEMLMARREFLNSGCYQTICSDIILNIQKYCPQKEPVILDVGCGEGYYTDQIQKECQAVCIGADISKNAVKMACSRNKEILWIAATGSHLPLADGSVDGITAVFSLFMNDEYARILKSGGCFIEICAGSGHLIELKEIIYEKVFEQHKHPKVCGSQFREVLCEEHSFDFVLNHDELQKFLLMTPHFWRIKKEKRDELERIEHLKLTANYWLRVLVKK